MIGISQEQVCKTATIEEKALKFALSLTSTLHRRFIPKYPNITRSKRQSHHEIRCNKQPGQCDHGTPKTTILPSYRSAVEIMTILWLHAVFFGDAVVVANISVFTIEIGGRTIVVVEAVFVVGEGHGWV